MCVRLPRPDISSEEMEEASKAMGYGAGERAGVVCGGGGGGGLPGGG